MVHPPSGSSLVVKDTTFTTWPKEMCPGHCFVWYAGKVSEPPLICYSIVLATDAESREKGLRRTFTFPKGQEVLVDEAVAVILLSEEQMTLARRLGWPQDDDALGQVFSVQPS